MATAKKQDEVKEEAMSEEIIDGTIQENTQKSDSKKEVKTTKAGKHSAKAVAEAEAEEARQARKEANIEAELEEDAKPKQKANPTRSRLERSGKKFRDASSKVEKDKEYTIAEAIALAVATSPVKFDATVELHINLNVDPRHADQNIRDNLVLPAGTGKKIRVAAFADENTEGADIAGVEAITKELDKGVISFDVLITSPANMPKLGKYARTLGPRGLMPNPKSGTVTQDVANAIKQAKAGRVEYRVDSTGIVHLGIGKVSFGEAKIAENLAAVLASIKGNKPQSVKGVYVKAVHITTTMGPSITVAVSEV